MRYTEADEQALAAITSRPGDLAAWDPAAGSPHYQWVSRLADDYLRLYSIPPAQRGKTPSPGDYGIDWPREIEVELSERLGQVFVKAYFPDRVVGIVKPVPRRPPKPGDRRIYRLLIKAAEHAMHYPEAWTSP